MSHAAEGGEDDEASDDAGDEVHETDEQSVPVHIASATSSTRALDTRKHTLRYRYV